MYEEFNQKISRLVDGDLERDDTLDLLKKMQSDDACKQKMARYQAIGHAIKADMFHQVSPDFSRKVFQEIQKEPTHFLPQLRPHTQPQIDNKSSKRKVLVIAASALVAAVLIRQVIVKDRPLNQYPTVTAMTVPQQTLRPSLSNSERSRQNNRHPLNAQFNAYLQAHNSSVYTNGEANFQPYASVTAYSRD